MYAWWQFDLLNSKNEGPTEIRTRIAGFKVQSANHYTIGPTHYRVRLKTYCFVSNRRIEQSEPRLIIKCSGVIHLCVS